MQTSLRVCVPSIISSAIFTSNVPMAFLVLLILNTIDIMFLLLPRAHRAIQAGVVEMEKMYVLYLSILEDEKIQKIPFPLERYKLAFVTNFLKITQRHLLVNCREKKERD